MKEEYGKKDGYSNKMDIDEPLPIINYNKIKQPESTLNNNLIKETKPPQLSTITNTNNPKKNPKQITSNSNPSSDLHDHEHEDESNLTNEEIEDLFREKLGNEIISGFNDPKWESRKNSFVELANYVKTNSDDCNKHIDIILRFIKLKLKDYKENNFNIIKEAINVFIALAENCEGFVKKHSYIVVKKLHEKFGDNKLKVAVAELFLIFMQYHGPKYITNVIIKYMHSVKGPTILKEFGLFLETVIQEFGINIIPIKEIVEFSKILASNPNPQLRNVATTILCLIYKNIGPTIKKFLNDIKEATLKVIESEFEKITVNTSASDQSNTIKRDLIGLALHELPKTHDGGKSGKNQQTSSTNVLDNIFPRIDISKKLNVNKIIKDLAEGKWAQKKETLELLEKTLNDSNMRILPNGLNEIVIALKNKLNDGNKNLIRLIVQFITKLVEAVGNASKAFIKTLIPLILSNLSDKQSLVRDDVIKCLDKWVEFVGIESLFPYFPQCFVMDNFEIRSDLLKFIIRHKKGLNKCIDLGNKELIHSVTLCHLDKSTNIRLLADELTKEMLKYININNFYTAGKDFKPAISSVLKQIFDKIAGETMGIGVVLDINLANVNANACISARNLKRDVELALPNGLIQPFAIDDILINNSNKLQSHVNLNIPDKKKEPTPELIHSLNNKMVLENSNFNNNTKSNNNPNKEKHSEITPNKLLITNNLTNINSKNKNHQSPSPNTLCFLIHKNIKPYQKQKRLNDELSMSFPIDFFSEAYSKNLKFSISSYINSHYINDNASDFPKLNNYFIQLQNALLNEPLYFTEIQDIVLKWVMIKNNENSGVFFSTMTLDFIDNLLNFQIDNEYTSFHILEEKLIFEIIIGKLLSTNTSTRAKSKSSLIIFGKAISFNNFLDLVVSRTRIIIDIEVQKILCEVLLIYACAYVGTNPGIILNQIHLNIGLNKEILNELVLLLNIKNEEIKNKIIEIVKVLQEKCPEINQVIMNAPKNLFQILRKNIPALQGMEQISDFNTDNQTQSHIQLNNIIKNKLLNIPSTGVITTQNNPNRFINNLNQQDLHNQNNHISTEKKLPSLLQTYRNMSRSPIHLNYNATESARKDFNVFDNMKLEYLLSNMRNGDLKEKVIHY